VDRKEKDTSSLNDYESPHRLCACGSQQRSLSRRLKVKALFCECDREVKYGLHRNINLEEGGLSVYGYGYLLASNITGDHAFQQPHKS
jgi:hypothetical protein